MQLFRAVGWKLMASRFIPSGLWKLHLSSEDRPCCWSLGRLLSWRCEIRSPYGTEAGQNSVLLPQFTGLTSHAQLPSCSHVMACRFWRFLQFVAPRELGNCLLSKSLLSQPEKARAFCSQMKYMCSWFLRTNCMPDMFPFIACEWIISLACLSREL